MISTDLSCQPSEQQRKGTAAFSSCHFAVFVIGSFLSNSRWNSSKVMPSSIPQPAFWNYSSKSAGFSLSSSTAPVQSGAHRCPLVTAPVNCKILQPSRLLHAFDCQMIFFLIENEMIYKNIAFLPGSCSDHVAFICLKVLPVHNGSHRRVVNNDFHKIIPLFTNRDI